ELSSSSGYWLHAPNGGPLTRLWTHSTKQKKVRTTEAPTAPGVRLAKLPLTAVGSVGNVGQKEDFAAVARRQERFIWGGDSPLGFADSSRPLVVDVGCGFGVSLLGLAQAAAAGAGRENNGNSSMDSSTWSGCNFLGCDLSSHCVAYAQGLAKRWNIDSECRFCIAPAEDFLQWVLDHYPGPVVWVLIQFPTPYKLDLSLSAGGLNKLKKKTGTAVGKNSQLPTMKQGTGEGEGEDDSGFMVTLALMSLAIRIAQKCLALQQQQAHRCCIYAQSNVEDVAVTMLHHFDNALSKVPTGVEYLTAHASAPIYSTADSLVHSKRQLMWAAAGGERAPTTATTVTTVTKDVSKKLTKTKATAAAPVSTPWLGASPLPLWGRTETEAAYANMSKPVFRVAWKIV
ncbi:hypothetical protein B484DRAFT_434790, partial [Ochromonadaceae sp. CCMP2298]